MTKIDAMRATQDNFDLIGRKVKFQEELFIVKRFLIDQFERDNYKVIVSLEKQAGIEFTVNLQDFVDYEIVDNGL